MKKVLLFFVIMIILAGFSTLLIAQESEPPPPPAPVSVHTPVPVFQIIEMQPFTYCAVEMTGSYNQHETAFGTLYTAGTMQGLSMKEIAFGIYYDNPNVTPEEKLSWEVGFIVPEGTEVKEPLVLKTWEYRMLARTEYKGPMEAPEMEQTYTELYNWIAENNMVPEGPIMERYLSAPVPDENGVITIQSEIFVPVTKAEE
ncbi:GyrI-like domain-containing protein [bacterium]|nr:GyrI-like domain-containing protein [bacterium]